MSAFTRSLDVCPSHKFAEIIAERCVGRRHCRRPGRARREPVPVPFIKSTRFSAVFHIRPRLTAPVTRARRRRAISISDSDNEHCPAHPRRRFNLWMARPVPPPPAPFNLLLSRGWTSRSSPISQTSAATNIAVAIAMN